MMNEKATLIEYSEGDWAMLYEPTMKGPRVYKYYADDNGNEVIARPVPAGSRWCDILLEGDIKFNVVSTDSFSVRWKGVTGATVMPEDEFYSKFSELIEKNIWADTNSGAE